MARSKKGDTLTPTEMRQWLEQEIQDLSKAMELRMQEATQFVTAYAAGEIPASKAMDKLMRYQHRWGDSPIPGVVTDKDWSNEEIVERLDNALPNSVRKILDNYEKDPVKRGSKNR